jgi:hypothetical protein
MLCEALFLIGGVLRAIGLLAHGENHRSQANNLHVHSIVTPSLAIWKKHSSTIIYDPCFFITIAFEVIA